MRTVLGFLGLVFGPALALAAVYEVAPDGTGDFPTIQAALDAAEPGDVIDLASGTFTGDGNRDLDFLGKAVTVRSAAGDPATCILDCQGSDAEPHRGFRFHGGELGSSILAAVSVVNGYIAEEPFGGAILCEGGSSPSIRSCLFMGNRGSAVVCAGGAAAEFEECVFVQNQGWDGGAAASNSSSPAFRRCTFQGNSAEWAGGAFHGHASAAAFSECEFTGNTAPLSGAAQLIFGGSYDFTDCRFRENSAQEHGAVLVFFCTARLTRCTFAQNTAAYAGAAISSGKMSYTYLANCTFWGNGAAGGTLFLGERESTLTNCIIAFGTQGPAMGDYGPSQLSCCDIFGNAGGDWVGYIAGQFGVQGNIAADPLFCDPENGDFTLDVDSPCAPFSPAHPECDLAGAWPTGCGAVVTRLSSWSALKEQFR
jgi:predicted outer membrane repeat protein